MFIKGKSGNPAGRPKGNLKKKLRLKDYFSMKEVERLVKRAYEQAMSKPDLMKFLLEQIFGRAPQPFEGADGGEFVLRVLRYDENPVEALPGEVVQPKEIGESVVLSLPTNDTDATITTTETEGIPEEADNSGRSEAPAQAGGVQEGS